MSETRRILYLDDKPETVQPIVDHLNEEFEVTIESSAEKAEKRLLKEPFDIIILDWEMIQQQNAGEILRKIRSENVQIKVIMVTAKLYRLSDVATLVNLGISKLFFKNDVNLLQELSKGVKEVVESRDAIIQGLEDWISARKGTGKLVVHVAGQKSYTAAELLTEIKKNSEIGRKQAQAFTKLILDLLVAKQEKKKVR